MFAPSNRKGARVFVSTACLKRKMTGSESSVEKTKIKSTSTAHRNDSRVSIP